MTPIEFYQKYGYTCDPVVYEYLTDKILDCHDRRAALCVDAEAIGELRKLLETDISMEDHNALSAQIYRKGLELKARRDKINAELYYFKPIVKILDGLLHTHPEYKTEAA